MYILGITDGNFIYDILLYKSILVLSSVQEAANHSKILSKD